jgi:hypothetical protein
LECPKTIVEDPDPDSVDPYLIGLLDPDA